MKRRGQPIVYPLCSLCGYRSLISERERELAACGICMRASGAPRRYQRHRDEWPAPEVPSQKEEGDK